MPATDINLIFSGMKPMEQYFKVGATMEAAGVMYSPFYVSGRPGQAIHPTPGLGGEALLTYSGQIPFYNPPSGKYTYLARFSMSAGSAGTAYLCDRLWHNSNINPATTTEQYISSVQWPDRCPDVENFNLANHSGHNIMIGIEVTTGATTNGSAVTLTRMRYTNSEGVSGRIASIASFPQSAVAGTFVPFQLASGDKGVKRVEGITLGTSYVAGTPILVAYRVIAVSGNPIGYGGGAVDPITGGLPQMFDNSVPFVLWNPAAVTAVTLNGSVIYTQC